MKNACKRNRTEIWSRLVGEAEKMKKKNVDKLCLITCLIYGIVECTQRYRKTIVSSTGPLYGYALNMR